MNTVWFYTKETEFGTVLLARHQQGVCTLIMEDNVERVTAELAARYPNTQLISGDLVCQQYLSTTLTGLQSDTTQSTIPLAIQGTSFQRDVWAAIQAIPRGETITYTELANKVGRASAVRAVANACGANRIAILIPCHRVVGKTGKLGGFRWGVARKQHLLTLEKRSPI
jgi:AraC family transcriptional regulator of adaptative response/methylated-DNA-[protein]-cysteine methyltransferase